MRRSLATVSLSGGLDEKLPALARAGFDGLELFDNDLVTSPWSPAEVRRRADDLGLGIDLFQPFRDVEAVPEDVFAGTLRRADRVFGVMEQLGTDTVLVCSSTSPHAVDDDELAATQLRTLAERAAEHGLRVAYEALAWGRHVADYRHSWRIVQAANHPALGLCLDSFHVLSRGDDPKHIEDVPAEKIFYLQLADAPRLGMDVLQWSRHYRCFPGQGGFDLQGFVGHVLAAGYRGPLSLEVFNDVFRQADPDRTAVDAMRSLLALEEQVATLPGTPRAQVQLCSPPPPTGLSAVAFTEIAVDKESSRAVGRALRGLGFAPAAEHRSKPVQLWQHGEICVLLNRGDSRFGDRLDADAVVTAIGLESEDPARSAARAEALRAPVLPRRRGPEEADLSAVAAPDGTSLFFCRTGPDETAGWRGDFVPVTGPEQATAAPVLDRVDHVGLSQPFDHFDEAVLFYRSVLGLTPQESLEFAAPDGLVRSRALRTGDAAVRIAISVSLLGRGGGRSELEAQHVAFGCEDVFRAAEAMRAAGAAFLPIPDNYYEDLQARTDLEPALVERMRSYGVLHDADEHGAFLHLFTPMVGRRLFFEVVQRLGGYDGYGAANAPVRMAAQRGAA